MITYNKAIKKLIVIQHLDEFKKIINSISRNEKLVKMTNRLEKFDVKEITLPNTFESILHTNILIECKHLDIEEVRNSNEDEFDNEKKHIEFIPDFITIQKELLNEFECQEDCKIKLKNDLKDKIIDIKHEIIKTNEALKEMGYLYSDLSIFLSEYVVELLKETWRIIERYFPIDKFGYPTMNFYTLLFNTIFNGDSKIHKEYYLVKNNDMYGIKLKIENRMLREILISHNIDVDEELSKKGFLLQLYELDEVLGFSDGAYLNINPSFTVENIRGNEFNIIADSLGKVYKKELEKQNNNFIKYITKVNELAKTYIDIRFNKKKTLKEIQIFLDLHRKSINSSETKISTIRKHLKYLAAIGDLSKEEEELENLIDCC